MTVVPYAVLGLMFKFSIRSSVLLTKLHVEIFGGEPPEQLLGREVCLVGVFTLAWRIGIH
jgi:hypothetical protein